MIIVNNTMLYTGKLLRINGKYSHYTHTHKVTTWGEGGVS